MTVLVLVDADNLALIESMAQAGGFQIWIEQVDMTPQGHTYDGPGILIEDGIGSN